MKYFPSSQFSCRCWIKCPWREDDIVADFVTRLLYCCETTKFSNEFWSAHYNTVIKVDKRLTLFVARAGGRFYQRLRGCYRIANGIEERLEPSKLGKWAVRILVEIKVNHCDVQSNLWWSSRNSWSFDFNSLMLEMVARCGECEWTKFIADKWGMISEDYKKQDISFEELFYFAVHYDNYVHIVTLLTKKIYIPLGKSTFDSRLGLSSTRLENIFVCLCFI